MSGLSYLCDYGNQSDSEESVKDDKENNPKKKKLPAPDLSKVNVLLSEEHIDDSSQHSGRVRSIPHIRGNWATYVYVKYPNDCSLSKVIKKIKTLLLAKDNSLQECNDIHISISRTVFLKYHMIPAFCSALQKGLSNFKSFDLEFDSIEIYTNDENNRTFVALKTDYFSNKYLLNITKEIDSILEEFKLPKFYPDPSFHMSLLWTAGDKKKELKDQIHNLNTVFTEDTNYVLPTALIDKVNCKSGNKFFQYSLD